MWRRCHRRRSSCKCRRLRQRRRRHLATVCLSVVSLPDSPPCPTVCFSQCPLWPPVFRLSPLLAAFPDNETVAATPATRLVFGPFRCFPLGKMKFISCNLLVRRAYYSHTRNPQCEMTFSTLGKPCGKWQVKPVRRLSKFFRVVVVATCCNLHCFYFS